MPLPGHYRINFTSAEKGSFVIEPNTTDGAVTPTDVRLDSKATSANTSLLLYGKGVPDYGERIAENLVHLLENYAGPVPPANPTYGQLWFDTGSFYQVSLTNEITNEIAIDGNHVSEFGQSNTSFVFKTVNFSDPNVPTVTSRVVNGAVRYDAVEDRTMIPLQGNITSQMANEYVTFAAPVDRLRVYKPDTESMVVAGEGSWTTVGLPTVTTGEAPSDETISVGEMWYKIDEVDISRSQLFIYNGVSWVAPSEQYLHRIDGGELIGYVTGQMPRPDVGGENDLVIRQYVDTEVSTRLSNQGDVMYGALTMAADTGVDLGLNSITNLFTTSETNYQYPDVNNQYEAVNKDYVGKALIAAGALGGGTTTGYINPDDGVPSGDITFNIPASGISDGVVFTSNTNDFSVKALDDVFRINLSGPTASSSSVVFTNSGNSLTPGLDGSYTNLLEIQSAQVRIDNVPLQLVPDVTDSLLYTDFQAATHGYVQERIADAVLSGGSGGSGTTVTALQYVESPPTGFETFWNRDLSLSQDDGTILTVALDHVHESTEMQVTYSTAVDSNERLANTFGATSNTNEAIIQLDIEKLPATDGTIHNAASVLRSSEIVSFDDVGQYIVVDDELDSILFGGDFVQLGHASLPGITAEYTVASVTYDSLSDTTRIDVVEALTVGSYTYVNFPAMAQEVDEVTTKNYVDKSNGVTRLNGESVNGQMTYTTPEYRVGSEKLQVYIGGLKMIRGVHYAESGALDTFSTSITFINTAPSDYPALGITGETYPLYEFIVMGQEYATIAD